MENHYALLVDERERAKLVNSVRYRQLNQELRWRLRAEGEAYWNKVVEELEGAAAAKNV